MNTKKLQFYFFIALLLIAFGFTLAILKPFVAPLALAFMTAIVVRPMYKRLLITFGHRKTISALATVLLVLIIILAPLSLLIQQVSVESYNFYTGVRDQGLGDFDKMAAYFIEPIQQFFPDWDPDVETSVKEFLAGLNLDARGIFSSTASIGLRLLIAIMALFYMLRDGHRFREAIVKFSPLIDEYDNEIIGKIEKAVNSVVRGSLFTSLIKGVLASIGFFAFGIPHPLLWGALTAVVSLLPGIGAGITLIPAVLYLLAIDSIGAAIGLTLWGAIVVGLVDNILMPIVVAKGFTVHPLLVLLSVLGGIIFFGPIGLFLGPLVIALLLALLEIYKLIILDEGQKT
jgi:predicted PurR-regulated permease PerM